MPEPTRKTDTPDTPDTPDTSDFEALKQAFDDLGRAGQVLLSAVQAGAKAFTDAFEANLKAAEKTTESDT